MVGRSTTTGQAGQLSLGFPPVLGEPSDHDLGCDLESDIEAGHGLEGREAACYRCLRVSAEDRIMPIGGGGGGACR